ncbi:MAG TPA: cytochrome c biogenesis protein CcsA [Chthoniobacterales bacterium]
MDRLWLVLSTFCYLLSFGYTLFAIRSGRFLPSRFNFICVTTGFVFQTVFLHLRGQAIGRCPLTNLFEVFIFVSWSMALIYMIVGTAYRLSLMGAFTSPVVVFIQTTALLLPVDQPQVTPSPTNAWLELHASFSIVAYGAFLLAGVAGAMYLMMDRQLKQRKIGSSFYRLPPVNQLAIANKRLVLLGFILLTLGVTAGFFVGRPLNMIHVGWSLLVWVIYGVVLFGRKWHAIAPRWMATASVVAFSIVLVTLWGVTIISEGPR